MCDKYVNLYHKETIYEILEDANEDKHFSFNINFLELVENDPNLGNQILIGPETALQEWDYAIRRVQSALITQSERDLVYKRNVHCRIYSLPVCPEWRRTVFPRNEDANKFLQVSGTVIRMTAMKMLEYQRQYICVKCKHVMIVTAEYELNNIIEPPDSCTNPEGCNGTKMISTGELNPDFCKDYQEIKLQQNVSKLEVGAIPATMWVTLEDDLVDTCKPGDNIIVCGTVKRRWGPFVIGKRMVSELVIKANHIIISNNSSATSASPELKEMFEAFWKTYSHNALAARDMILQSLCPQLFGLSMVKLAVAVVLAGGSHTPDGSSAGVRVRSEPHLLLVGDPGTGKSQLLRFASKIIPRSVLTTGVGSTAAGLTVTAVMENGEWQLEAGALVLADGGICCIDEFNSMKEHDRTSIHEAMEQQTISVAKASIVCKLSTRCSILAATNPKGNLDPSQALTMNIALPSPLLSRFDLILLLRDKVDEQRDKQVIHFILNSGHNLPKLTNNIFWTVETLQAYFSLIKKINPILSEDSNKILKSYYQAQRRKTSRNKARTTVRMLDSLVRLSQGHARLMFHQEVQVVDAVTAVILVDTSVENNSSVFNLQCDVQNDFPENPTETYKELVQIVLNKLGLPDLLEKELDSLDTKNVYKKPETTVTDGVTTTIESRFFRSPKKISKNRENPNHQGSITGIEKTEMAQVNDDNNQEHTEIKIQYEEEDKKSKRMEEINDSNPKRRKLGVPEHEICNDLVALDRIPSVNDIFPILDDLEIEESLASGYKTKESENDDTNIEEVSRRIKENKNNAIEDNKDTEVDPKTIQNTKNKNVDTNIEKVRRDKENKNNRVEDNKDTEVEPKMATNTNKRTRLDRFRFVPRDVETDPEVTTTEQFKQCSEAINNENRATDLEVIIKKSKCSEEINNASQTSSINEDILKDLESVPQSTQCDKPKFTFKKTTGININTVSVESQSPKIPETDKANPTKVTTSGTIFETDDLDDLDLDL